MRDKDRKLKEAESRYVSVKHCFECLVCKETTTFPALVSTCCNIVLGCKLHVEEWLETTAQCPHCREPMEMTDCTVIPFMEDWFSDSATILKNPRLKSSGNPCRWKRRSLGRTNQPFPQSDGHDENVQAGDS